MSFKGVLRNVRKHGIRGMLDIRKKRNAQKQNIAQVEAELEPLRKLAFACRESLKASDNDLNDSAVRAHLDEYLSIAGPTLLRLLDESAGYSVSRSMIVEDLDEYFSIAGPSLLKQVDKSIEGEGFDSAILERFSVYFLIAGKKALHKGGNQLVSEFLAELKERETPQFREWLRKEYITKRIPEAYAMHASDPLEKKAVFLQPRSGVNQAFKYMYKYLNEKTDYKVAFHELHRAECPYALFYWGAERFAADAASAKVVFLHESNELLGHTKIREDSKVVQLWHGCGVLKKIGLDTAGQKGSKSLAGYRDYPEYNYFDMVTIAGPDLTWVFEQFMGIPRESGIIQPIGVSRTDYFFDDAYIKRCYEKLYERIPQARDKKVVLYAPTYRGRGNSRVAPDALDIPYMAKELGDDWILIIKQHQTVAECPEIPEPYRDSFAYDMTRGKGMDIAELMTVSDVCVSDYSSVVFEFALFDRPMAFFVYDLEEYIDKRGLYYDFDEVTPGPLCHTTEELVDYLAHIDERFDKDEVAAFCKRFMCACDGHSTERILHYIETGEIRYSDAVTEQMQQND